jgi:hypothetical protein
LDDIYDLTHFLCLESLVFANAYVLFIAVEFQNHFTAPCEDMNVGWTMIMREDFDVVAVDTENGRHKDIRIAKRLGYLGDVEGLTDLEGG